MTVAGHTDSTNYPTTSNAYDTDYNGGGSVGRYFGDVFVTRLDPSMTGLDQLIYSTYVGGSGGEFANALSVLLGSGTVVVNVSWGDRW